MTRNRQAPWTVYMVQCADGTLYTGIARDVDQRVAAHNAGNGAKYTKSRRPVRLVYVESAVSRSAAAKREIRIKKLSSAQKHALVAAGMR